MKSKEKIISPPNQKHSLHSNNAAQVFQQKSFEFKLPCTFEEANSIKQNLPISREPVRKGSNPIPIINPNKETKPKDQGFEVGSYKQHKKDAFSLKTFLLLSEQNNNPIQKETIKQSENKSTMDLSGAHNDLEFVFDFE